MGNTFTVVRLRHPIEEIDPYALDSIFVTRVGGTMTGSLDGLIKLSLKKASKPADPAFKNALRWSRMHIGLRYPGD